MSVRCVNTNHGRRAYRYECMGVCFYVLSSPNGIRPSEAYNPSSSRLLVGSVIMHSLVEELDTTVSQSVSLSVRVPPFICLGLYKEIGR